MESIGEKLKAAREANGYSFEQIARDTHISKRFLMALEDEDFSVFPGEPYILGFLKNYSEFIGLNPHELLSLYKNIKLQEQPVPMEELLETGRPFPWKAVGIAAAVCLVAALGYLVYSNIGSVNAAGWQEPAHKQPAPEKKIGTEYPLEDTALEQKFTAGDSVIITRGDTVYKLSLSIESNNLMLLSPAGPVKLVKQEERGVDLDADGNADVKVLFKDFNEKDPKNSLLLRFERLDASQPGAVAASLDQAIIGSSNAAARKQVPVVITQAQVPGPFVVDVKFSVQSLFRYIADSDVRQEKYYETNESFNMSVRREIRIWTSNAGSLIMTVAGKNIQLGAVGEVATKTIRWVKDEGTGGYSLMLIPVY